MNYIKFYGGGSFNIDSLTKTTEAQIYRNQNPKYANLTDEQVLQMKQLNEEADADQELMDQTATETVSADSRQKSAEMLAADPDLANKVQELKDRGVTPEVQKTEGSVGGENTPVSPEVSNKASSGLSSQGFGMIAQAGVGAMKAIDNLAMGDKNFGAQSQAIDSAVHGVSSALMSSGNPYAMAAGAALEGANFLTKAGGQTVQGFDVNIENSGFGNLGHMESSSSRDFGAMIGLGGLFNQGAMKRKLAKRNEQARMALAAAEISNDIKFEQEARANSVDNVLMNNQIALAGGTDTSLLAAKHGARLESIYKQRKRINPDPEEVIVHENVIIDMPEEVIIESPVVKAQNGAKLEHIEISEEQNVIPSGAMHKNKNHIDLDITEKGIPVITVEDDSVETFEEIKEQEDTLVQHAEVEEAEIIFNKELTIFIENLRKQWHEKDKNDDSICLEAGMRLAKEIIENTEDNTDVTEKSMEAVENENN